MKIKETKDMQEIKSILCHPAIYDCISDDNSPKSSEFQPTKDAEYVGCYLNDDIIGLMIYHTVNGDVKCHIQMLPEFRKKYARKFARMALNFGKAKNASIYAEIPVCYPSVINFAEDVGFIQTGYIEDSYLKNGHYHDVIKMRRIWDLSQIHSMH